MVKYISFIYCLFLFASCQHKCDCETKPETSILTYNQREALDEMGGNYFTLLTQQQSVCKERFRLYPIWQPSKGYSPISLQNKSFHTFIPCAHITKPAYQLFNFTKSMRNNFEKQFPLTTAGMYSIIAFNYLELTFFFRDALLSDYKDAIQKVHEKLPKGAIYQLDNLPNAHPKKEKFATEIENLLHSISSSYSDSGSTQSIIVPADFYPYYNTEVIDRKWILDVFEKSGEYRAWLDYYKPFVDEIANILPEEKYVSYFYKCYNAPQIDSNFSVYKFSKMLEPDSSIFLN